MAVLLVLLAALQWRLWFGDGSLQELSRLRDESAHSRTEVLRLTMRNQALAAEVTDLKSGLDAIEERARGELGMIGEGETFYQFIHESGANGQSLKATQAASSTEKATGVRRSQTYTDQLGTPVNAIRKGVDQ